MNRRLFLLASGSVLVGCTKPAAPVVLDTSRLDHLRMLEGCRVPSNATRTTPKAKIDVVAQFPELKPLLRVAVRLHPRFSEEPRPEESKLGGQFLWPANEDWPLCPEFREPMQPILQLRSTEASPQFPFRPNTDLFQLLWSPKKTTSQRPHAVGVWRKAAEVGASLAESPPVAFADWTPVPCRLFPERVTELPRQAAMPAYMSEKVRTADFANVYDQELAVATGTKVGGWPNAITTVRCTVCQQLMDYLLTIDSCEWTERTTRWKPVEDDDRDGFRRAPGLTFSGDGSVQVYVCRRCEKWPLRCVVSPAIS